MKITWLGQAGFLLEKNGKKILLDPYLSDACGAVNPASHRRTPLDEHYLHIKPDAILLTHDHIDHTDNETLKHYLPGAGGILVLAGANAWTKVRGFGGDNDVKTLSKIYNGIIFTFLYAPIVVLIIYSFNEGKSRVRWEGFTFTAVCAEHSDPEAIGFIVDDSSKKYYFTGDTLYSEAVFAQLPKDLYAVFLPINGKGNNMNPTDAAAFAARTGAKYSIPMHFGMFDQLNPKLFTADNALIPTVYQSVFPEEIE